MAVRMGWWGLLGEWRHHLLLKQLSSFVIAFHLSLPIRATANSEDGYSPCLLSEGSGDLSCPSSCCTTTQAPEVLAPPTSVFPILPSPQLPSHLLSVSKSWYDLGFDRLVARFEDGMRNRSLGEERVFSLPTLLFSHPV